ncbi:MAG: SusC/RagA family TonB-linked outer membrane protein, partial [Parafilimonas sp.]
MNKTRLLRAFILSSLFTFVMQQTWAQNKTVTGKITDEKGNPVAGASVVVKGTKIGASTDASGSFRINAPASATTLVVTYVGYASQNADISSATDVTVSLSPESSALTDVVVIGYSTARKKDVTGSISSVKEKDFNKGIYTAPDQLIQGKVAGVQITNNSGQPGGAISVRIRGTASVRTGGQPLYVVDGVPLDGRSARPGLDAQGLGTTPDANPLNFINPSDIASIDVLKDASATAIYGSRGANGVIIITTKRGQSGEPKIEYSGYAGFSDVLKKLSVLDAATYKQALDKYGIMGADWGGNVDAFDAVTGSAFLENHNISVSGGNENARFRASLGFLDQNGIVRKSGLKKYSANINGNFKFLDSRKLGLDVYITASQISEQIAPVTTTAGFEGSLIGQALQWNPTRPLRNEDGSLNLSGAD